MCHDLQAIKQKLQIRPRVTVEEGGTPQEEDKARLLLGGLSMVTSTALLHTFRSLASTFT